MTSTVLPPAEGSSSAGWKPSTTADKPGIRTPTYFLHAICDALLGAAALGGIGRHFPVGDPRYRDISSLELLRRTVALLVEAGVK